MGSTYLIQEISMHDCVLYSLKVSSRFKIADCKAILKVYEDRLELPVQGTRKPQIKKHRYVLCLCSDMSYSTNLSMADIAGLYPYGVKGFAVNQSGEYIQVEISNMQPIELDMDGEWIFELPAMPESIKGLFA